MRSFAFWSFFVGDHFIVCSSVDFSSVRRLWSLLQCRLMVQLLALLRNRATMQLTSHGPRFLCRTTVCHFMHSWPKVANFVFVSMIKAANAAANTNNMSCDCLMRVCFPCNDSNNEDDKPDPRLSLFVSSSHMTSQDDPNTSPAWFVPEEEMECTGVNNNSAFSFLPWLDNVSGEDEDVLADNGRVVNAEMTMPTASGKMAHDEARLSK